MNFCFCKHPLDEKGRRVFLSGAYPDAEDSTIWYCGRCNGVIPMTTNQKLQFQEELERKNEHSE